MSGKNRNFDNKKIKTKTEINKNKKLFQIDDVDVNKILISKKEPCVQRIHLNTLLDTIRIMLLDPCVQRFHKWEAMLIKLMKMQQCL